MESFVEVIQEQEKIIANGDYTKVLGVQASKAFSLTQGVRVKAYPDPSYLNIKRYASGAWNKTKQLPPVTVEERMIHVYPERLKTEQYYPISYLGKKYLVCSPKKGIIDFYEVVE
jgi:hypothetical protein